MPFYATAAAMVAANEKLTQLIAATNDQIRDAVADAKPNDPFGGPNTQFMMSGMLVTNGLKELIPQCVVVEDDDIDTTTAGFGTKVTVRWEKTGKTEVIQIGGPLEINVYGHVGSDIVSHYSEVGIIFKKKEIGDTLTLWGNEAQIVKIEKFSPPVL